MKKHLFILFLIASLVITLSACQAAGPAAGGTEAPTQAPTQAPTEPSLLTAGEAQAIALKAAGVTEYTHLRTRFEVDDGVEEYEVDFRAGDWEYEYTVHAVTGRILSSDKELEPLPADPTDPPVQPTQKPAEKPTEPPEVVYISGEDAETIALKHAGLDRADVRFDRTELDKDDGVPEYEIEFYANGWEYSYEIHAESGRILHSEKEKDD